MPVDYVPRCVHRRATFGVTRHHRRVDVTHRVCRRGPQGPGRHAHPLSSFADYVRTFGDVMDTTHPMGHAVGQFFTNGGGQAIIVRALGAGATSAVLALPAVKGLKLTLTARSRGAWANGSGGGNAADRAVRRGDRAVDNPSDRFTLELIEWAPGVGGGPATKLTRENWAELTMSPGNTRYVVNVLNASTLVTAEVTGTPGPRQGPEARRPRLPPGVNVSGKALRLSVDQGPATDYVLFPAENPPVRTHWRTSSTTSTRPVRSGPSWRASRAARSCSRARPAGSTVPWWSG